MVLWRRMRTHPWVSSTATLVVVAAVVVGVVLLTRSSSSATAAAAVTERTEAVSTGTVRAEVTSTGTLEPAVQDSLNFPVSGDVTSVSAQVGQVVKAGQVLATINSASLAATLAQAKAQLATDQSRLTSDTDDSADATQLSADRAAVSAATGQVADDQTSLDEATMTSPVAGEVASVDLTVGQAVTGSTAGASGSSSGSSAGSSSGTSAGSSSGSGTSTSSAQVLVISTGSWVVNASVDDTEIGLLAKGDQAQITADGVTSTVYGTISSVGVLPSSTTGTASYPVTVAVTGSPTGLHAGASATVSLIYKQATGVVVVPTLALHTADGTQSVTVVQNGKNSDRTVTTGLASGGSTQILTGLSAGEQILVPTVTRAGGTGTARRTGTGTGGYGGGFGGTGGFGGGTGGFGGGASGFTGRTGG